MIRYRALDANFDYTIGQNGQNFLVDSPAAVGQAVRTRLLLFQGEHFVDTTVGMPWYSQVLGRNTLSTYNQAIKEVIKGTPGVSDINNYSADIVATGQVQSELEANADGWGTNEGGFGGDGWGAPDSDEQIVTTTDVLQARNLVLNVDVNTIYGETVNVQMQVPLNESFA